MQHGKRKPIIGLHCNHGNHLTLVLNQEGNGYCVISLWGLFFHGSHAAKANTLLSFRVWRCVLKPSICLTHTNTNTPNNDCTHTQRQCKGCAYDSQGTYKNVKAWAHVNPKIIWDYKKHHWNVDVNHYFRTLNPVQSSDCRLAVYWFKKLQFKPEVT